MRSKFLYGAIGKRRVPRQETASSLDISDRVEPPTLGDVSRYGLVYRAHSRTSSGRALCAVAPTGATARVIGACASRLRVGLIAGLEWMDANA
jgi:hypothetical protein